MLKELKQKFEKVTNPKLLAEIGYEILESQDEFDRQKEHFIAIGLNTKNIPQYADVVSVGTLDASLVHPRETFRRAVHQGVSSIALLHNHPSGDTSPSQEDLKVTERLIEAGKVLGIDVLDHVIIGADPYKFHSIREHDTHYFAWPS